MKRKKNEEHEESQITKINIFGFTFYIKNYILLENIFRKKVVYTIKSRSQFLCVAGYLKHNNDKTKLNKAQYTQISNYNIIEIYINRLSATTQIFIAMDYLTLMLEK